MTRLLRRLFIACLVFSLCLGAVRAMASTGADTLAHVLHGSTSTASSSATPTITGGPGHTKVPMPTHAQIVAAVDKVRAVPARIHRSGYDRSCSPGHACTFGPAWSDDTTAPGAHNGCGTRDDVMAKWMTDLQFKARTHNCVVLAGTLLDPYSGNVIHFTKARAQAVQVDHVLPLAAAYDLGAYQWTQSKRDAFANDIDVELIPVDGAANQAKGDSLPSKWMPANSWGKCLYVYRMALTADTYGLPLPVADLAVLRNTAAACYPQP